MQKKVKIKNHTLTAIVFFIVISFSVLLLLYGLDNVIPRVSVNAPNGIADLTEYDFSSSVAHIQDAEFYSGKLLSPEQMKYHAPDSHGFDNTARYNTARIRFYVPDGDYVIFGLSPKYACVIYINGKLTDTFGYIDENDDKNNVYRIAPFSAIAQPIDGVIELVAKSAGIIHETTSYDGFFISSYQTAKYRQQYDMAYHLIPVAILFICMLLFIGYYVFMPKVKANLWFALITFFTGFLLSGNNGIVTELLPSSGFNYIYEFYLGNIALLAISALYTLFLRSLYGIPKTVPIIACSLNAIFAVLLFFPFNMTSRYSIIHISFIFIIQLVCVVCVIGKIKSFKLEHIISFCGQIAFILGGTIDLLGTTGLIQSYNATSMGILVFTFAQMIALYLVNNRAVENEQHLAEENELLEKLNRKKTELFGNISHELKTPLTVISNVSQLVSRHTSDEYIKEKMQTAISEVKRMKVKVGHFIEFSKVEEAEIQWNFQAVDIIKIINETVQNCFQALDEHNNILSLELPEKLPDVKADPVYLQGVIVNLLDNSIRFTHNGKITIKALQNENFVVVSIEDTGCGMSQEQTEHIFERFYTCEKSTGTGLGLHICKKVIEAHGGTIEVESKLEQGTKISFTLGEYTKERSFKT